MQSWKLFLLNEYRNKAKILKLREMVQNKQQCQAFGAWVIYHKMCLIKKQMNYIARSHLMKQLCLPLWRNWQILAKNSRDRKILEQKAEKNYIECLLVKAFVSIKKEAQIQILKRENLQKAEILCNYFRKRRCFSCYKRNIKELIQEKLRNDVLKKIIGKVIGRFSKKICERRFLAWITRIRKSKSIFDSFSKAAKSLKKIVKN